MGEIALEGLEFYAYHGFYEEERKIGNRYSVDLKVTANLEEAAGSDDLSLGVNYEWLFQAAASAMQKQVRLLEHVAHNIIEEVRTKSDRILSVEVTVRKFNPPLGAICHCSRVTLQRNFQEKSDPQG